jgi:hypothetical protein
MATLVPTQPCTQCGQQLASSHWSYVYGKMRRGGNPRTGEFDRRPLGTDSAFLCRKCERDVLVAHIKEQIKSNPLGSSAALAIPVLALFGWRMGSLGTGAAIALAIVVAWLTLMWLLRRPKTMRRGLFLARRTTLAEQHGLKPHEIDAYLDEAADT